MPARIPALRTVVARLSRPQARHASTLFRMPAMSPTMTEGGIANWKKSEGDAFAAGDVLLEIETDKATIDVEAQDDGVMGKILARAGENKVPVGQVIAILAEEGDDLAAIEVPSDLAPEGAAAAAASPAQEKPKDSTPKQEPVAQASSSKTSNAEPASQDSHHHHHHEKITHSKPLFPSVYRLLADSSLTADEIAKLKGTGRHGMLTKGDVLFALGKIQHARGSAEKMVPTKVGGPDAKKAGETKTPADVKKPAAQPPMDGIAWRRAILAGLENATKPVLPLSSATSPLTAFETPAHEFDELLEPYSALFQKPPQPHVELPTIDLLAETKQHAHAGIVDPSKSVKDEWEGLF
ncbi:hypothetical protein NliqN6_0528 [Naganishia liquefaciens]|uniref:Lipoyl-binding domain-containing protein n=1 Tax=Naganishia liquefaciens TaxID=104408 RepID=A0A8H3TNQ9_9TREE|nr:hypothetical protein NliqN6_0528 [Naganishia liquefaciens]